MIRNITDAEKNLINDDPVRPHLSYEFRTSKGREIFVLENNNTVDAVICVAYTTDVPASEDDLELFSSSTGNIAVFYTVWSYTKGSGRDIVNQTASYIKYNKPVNRFVTLSPLTEMARNFHLSNGAKLLAEHSTCQNFEYTV